jgi:cytochrome c oxidase subunit 4
MSEQQKAAGGRTYVTVWLGLLVLTGLTVLSADLELGRLTIFSVLAIAAAKSTLVLLFFMHLRYEQRLIFKLLLPIAIVTLAIFIGLTFTDVATR